MSFNMEEVKDIVQQNYSTAKRNVLKKSLTEDSFKLAEPISDVIPGYSAREMEFGDYVRDNFTCVFIDIRNSTKRSQVIGPANTFLTLHAFFPGVAYTIEQYGGYVIDYMGDGVMALFGGKHSGVTKTYAIQRSGLCGLKLQQVVQNVINPLLDHDKIWKLSCGIGIDHGSVIVTKIGTASSNDIKAIGDCINRASKFSKGLDNVIVSDTVRKEWPKGKNGKVTFRRKTVNNETGYALIKTQ